MKRIGVLVLLLAFAAILGCTKETDKKKSSGSASPTPSAPSTDASSKGQGKIAEEPTTLPSPRPGQAGTAEEPQGSAMSKGNKPDEKAIEGPADAKSDQAGAMQERPAVIEKKVVSDPKPEDEKAADKAATQGKK